MFGMGLALHRSSKRLSCSHTLDAYRTYALERARSMSKHSNKNTCQHRYMLKPSWHQPLLGLLQCVPPPLLLQPPPSLLQLGEGVRSWVGGHGWVLDERMRGLDLGGRWAGEGGRHRGGVVTQLGRDPGVHSSRSLHWSGTWWLAAGCRPPGAAGAATGKQTEWETRWISKDLTKNIENRALPPLRLVHLGQYVMQLNYWFHFVLLSEVKVTDNMQSTWTMAVDIFMLSKYNPLF